MDAVQNAETVVLLDDETAARTAFARLVAERGRREASRIWVEATRRVESAVDYMDAPTRVAPDCEMACGESYVNDRCEPCTVFEEIRHPARAAAPYECVCGFGPIPASQTEAILDHCVACPSGGAPKDA